MDNDKQLQGNHYLLEIQEIFTRIPHVALNAKESEHAMERIKTLLDLYLQCPQLLDRHLGTYIDILLERVDIVKIEGNLLTPAADFSFQCMTQITKVRGYKIILMRLSHDVIYFIPVLNLIERIIATKSTKSKIIIHDQFEPSQQFSPSEDRTANCSWETEQSLLLWLTVIISNPFDLQKFAGMSDRLMTSRVEAVANYYIQSTKFIRIASLLLSQLTGRADTPPKILDDAIRSSCASLRKLSCSKLTNIITAEAIIRHMCVLATLMKRGPPREQLQSYCHLINDVFNELNWSTGDMLIRKGAIKVLQRIALVKLPPRDTKWRYNRGRRCLTEPPTSGTNVNSVESTIDEYDDFEIDELVEVIIGILLQSMSDCDSIVRWSTAKGLGRICSRLPRNDADQVVDAILQSVDTTENEHQWHSVCLTVAELCRRGCMLPTRLDKITIVVKKALIYDVRRGRHSIGSSVRDSAAYVCWALARAFTQTDLAKHIEPIAAQLIIVAITDRNISVRRAATSAFQELVGRHNQMLGHYADVMEQIDFTRVSNVMKCYTNHVHYLAIHNIFAMQLLDHILKTKINHWDILMRERASEGLAIVAKILPDLWNENDAERLRYLLKESIKPDIFARHGAILALARVMDVFLTLNLDINSDIMMQTINLPNLIYHQYKNLLEGVGAEPTRRALYFLILQLLKHNDKLRQQSIVDVLQLWKTIAMVSIGDTRDSLRKSAAECVGTLLAIPDSPDDWIRTLLESTPTSEPNCRGIVMAVGIAISKRSYQIDDRTLADQATKFVMKWTKVQNGPNELWALARSDAVNALSLILTQSRHPPSSDDVLRCLIDSALQDYTCDNRGDIGRFTRQSAVDAAFVAISKGGSQEIIQSTINILMKLICEPLDILRVAIVRGMRKMLKLGNIEVHNSELLRKVFINDVNEDCCDEELAEHIITIDDDDDDKDSVVNENTFENRLLIESEDLFTKRIRDDEKQCTNILFERNWHQRKYAYERLAPLITDSVYRKHAISGLLIAAGGLTESVQRLSIDIIVNFIQKCLDDLSLEEAKLKVDAIFEDIYEILHLASINKDNRTGKCTLVALDDLLTIDVISLIYEGSDVDNDIAWLPKLADLAASMTLTKKSFSIVIIGVNVQCAMLQFDPYSELYIRAVKRILKALIHPVYPVVRRRTAEKLYETLLLFGTFDNHNEQIATLLCNTSWDATDVEKLKEIKDQIAYLMKIE